MSPPQFSRHFDGERFFNPDAPQVRGFLELLRWQSTRRPERSPSFLSDVSPSKPPSRVDGEELRVTLINHSTVLLQQKGVNILTDPIWSERASPFRSLGPRRRRAPGVLFEDLPPIGIVLLSHNHYDHLDLPTLRRLAGRQPTQFIAPLGLGKFLRARKIGPARELDWGESLEIARTTIHSVPAQHFSARGLFDRNRTLWCGFEIETPGGMIYFAGDTGFGGHFARIREMFGAPRLALLPIGAYKPEWFMSSVHMAPDEAVQAHEILGARTSIAIHHGTFQLTDESIDTPKQKLRACLAGDSFLVLDNGESVALS